MSEPHRTRLRQPQGEVPGPEAEYPAAIEEMSEKWRAVQDQPPSLAQPSFIRRHYFLAGVGIGLLLISLLTVVGSFIFLVLNAH